MREARPQRRPAWLLPAAKIALSVLLLVLLAQAADLAAVRAALGALPPGAVILAGGALLAQTLVMGLRWHLVMRAVGAPLPAAAVTRLMFLGVFFNQILPSSVGGDGLRVWYAHRDGIAFRPALHGVLLERFSGVLGLALAVAAGAAYMGARLDSPALRLGLMAVLPICLALTFALVAVDRLPGRLRLRGMAGALAALAADSRAIFLDPSRAGWLLLLALASHGLAGLALYALARGMALPIGMADCLALMPAVTLATLVPVSLAGWGVREGAAVVLLGFAGLGAEAALAVSLAFGAVLLLAALPGGAIWLIGRRQRPAAGAAAP